MKMMEECLKPHSLLHTLTGIGLGLLLIALIPTLVSNALMLGIILVAASLVADMMMGKKK